MYGVLLSHLGRFQLHEHTGQNWLQSYSTCELHQCDLKTRPAQISPHGRLSFSILQILLWCLLARTCCLFTSTICETKESSTSHYITWLLFGHWQFKGGPWWCLFLPLHCQTLELLTFSCLPKHLWPSPFQKADFFTFSKTLRLFSLYLLFYSCSSFI